MASFKQVDSPLILLCLSLWAVGLYRELINSTRERIDIVQVNDTDNKLQVEAGLKPLTFG